MHFCMSDQVITAKPRNDVSIYKNVELSPSGANCAPINRFCGTVVGGVGQRKGLIPNSITPEMV